MTNEEKAEAIKINQPRVLFNPNYGTMIEYGALEMAKWKDNQFKEYLEKKIKTLVETNFPISLIGEDKGKYDAMQEIINELFGN